jgi:TfoX N-terminal domain
VAYDEELAHRIREMLALEDGVVEKRMFGGLAFLIGGHIAAAVSRGGGLLMRCPDDEWEELINDRHVRPFEMQGKAARGWLRVDAEGVAEEEDLTAWVQSGVGFARSLPPKR